jgi:hypothetical protein
MMVEASSARQVVERIDELATMLEHGEVERAKEFARDLHREASARLYADGFEDDA